MENPLTTLVLFQVCLGAEAEDKFHMVEVEGLGYDAKRAKVPIAVLKPSVLPSMNLGGFEITPPVTFRLVSGSGPVHISGQHFVSVKDSEDEEEENNTSPVKRPANLALGKKPPQKKIKMDSDDDDDDGEEEDSDEDEDDDDESDEEDVKPQKHVAKVLKKHAIQVQTVPGKRSKQSRCTYLRRERRSFPRGQMTAEHFCDLVIYSVVFSSKSSCIPPLPPSLPPSMTLILSFIVIPTLSLLMSTKYKAPQSRAGSNYSFDWKFSCFRINVLFLLSNFSTVLDNQNRESEITSSSPALLKRNCILLRLF
ncbi:hypothetical protein XENOCAPTIV_003955 [Xenoophorus captivus]|uniref:Nucleophosmin n=1 Tax=Xenoophorus captivus TaxID=1517983 RepID=A0ABV0S6Z4_9TELE